MPIPLIAGALLAGLPALQQIGSGIGQASKARKLRLEDTRPESFKEELAMRRLDANNQRMPGQAAAEERIAQGEANAYSNMVQSGTSSANVLAGLNSLNRNTGAARNNLSTQAAQFQQGSRERLVGTLRQDANYRQQDLQTFNRSKAALKEASNRNIYGGLSTAATVGMYGLTGGFNSLGSSSSSGAAYANGGLGLGSSFSQNQSSWRPPGQLPLIGEGDDDEFGMGAGYRNNSPYPPYNPNDIYRLNYLGR